MKHLRQYVGRNLHQFIATIFEEFSINKLLHVNAIVDAEVNITIDLV